MLVRRLLEVNDQPEITMGCEVRSESDQLGADSAICAKPLRHYSVGLILRRAGVLVTGCTAPPRIDVATRLGWDPTAS